MDPLEDFAFLLKDVSRLYSRNFERHAASVGLSLGDARVLRYLSRNPGLSQARLAWLTETDPMTLGRTLKRLEGEDLIERTPGAQDRRVLALSLRPKAAAYVRTTQRLSRRVLEEALAGVSAPERLRLLRLMRTVHANLDALVPGLAERGLRSPRPTTRRLPARRPSTRRSKAAR